MDEVLAPGAAVPEFELDGSIGPVVLRQLRGRPMVLSFYPADWSPVCGDQTALYNEVLSELYFDDAFTLKRSDYETDLLGAAHYCYDPVTVEGIVFPTLRRVVRRSPVTRNVGIEL
jgi:AhpC/TSA family